MLSIRSRCSPLLDISLMDIPRLALSLLTILAAYNTIFMMTSDHNMILGIEKEINSS